MHERHFGVREFIAICKNRETPSVLAASSMDILIIDDDKVIRDSTLVAFEAEGHYAEAVDSGRAAQLRLKEEGFDLALLDLRLGEEDGLDVLAEIKKRQPQVAVAVITAYGAVETAVKAMQLGAFDYLEKPFTPEQLRGLLARVEKQRRMKKRIAELESEVASRGPEPIFESSDRATHEALDLLFRAAPTPASILILGESGVGKSLVAREVHRRSHLKSKPFVTVNCPSLSRELLESELFGHVIGAFTGAVRDQFGKVHAASGGTLFLDEIGELPLDIQPKLLRLLQEREYERVGENKTRTAEVRVIAATNRDLKAAVARGEFREDLFFRLNVIAVEIPPLRDRPDDLLQFAGHYLDFFAAQSGRAGMKLSPAVRESLQGRPWRGNLRELRNAIERAVILTQHETLQPEDLPDPESAAAEGEEDSPKVGSATSLAELEAEHIRQILSRTSTIQEAAATLGIDQATLYRKRKKLGID